MAGGKIPINPILVGAIALVCLTGGAVLLLTLSHREDINLWAAGMIRVGLLMGAFWLAMPGKDRRAAWEGVSPSVLVGALLSLFVAVRFPWMLFRVMLPMLLIIGVVGWFLRPRSKRRPRQRQM